MPELPEVETVRRGLQPVMEGARIVRAELRRPDLRFPFPERLAMRMEGQAVISVSRRAKYLLFQLENGLTLLSHLGMSGSFRIEQDGPEENPGVFHRQRGKLLAHDHVVLSLRRPGGMECRVIYNDPRRFGFMDLIEAGGLDGNRFLRGLGVEPVGNALSGALLSELFAKKAAPLKSALLDQRLIAGLGNIYVCEALWRSGLSPERASHTICRTKLAERLAGNIREVIDEAIEAGGSSLRDHIQTDGSLGYFQHSFSVYDREGEECRTPRCKGTVNRIVQSGRSSFFCPACQK